MEWNAVSGSAARLHCTSNADVLYSLAVLHSTERLPHLAPETIRLVLSTTTSGVPEPPEERVDQGRVLEPERAHLTFPRTAIEPAA